MPRPPGSAPPEPPDAPATLVAGPAADAHPVAATDLPVVARLVIDIHSDGTRTVARGALVHADDSPAGHTRVAIEASGGTPMQLALQLGRSLASSLTPALLRQALTTRPAAAPARRTGLRARVRRALGGS